MKSRLENKTVKSFLFVFPFLVVLVGWTSYQTGHVKGNLLVTYLEISLFKIPHVHTVIIIQHCFSFEQCKVNDGSVHNTESNGSFCQRLVRD